MAVPWYEYFENIFQIFSIAGINLRVNIIIFNYECFCPQKIDLDTVEYAEDGKRDLISREIGKFREIMKVRIM